MERFFPKVMLNIQARGSGIVPTQHMLRPSAKVNEGQDSPGSAPLSKYYMDFGFRVGISAIRKNSFDRRTLWVLTGWAVARARKISTRLGDAVHPTSHVLVHHAEQSKPYHYSSGPTYSLDTCMQSMQEPGPLSHDLIGSAYSYRRKHCHLIL